MLVHWGQHGAKQRCYYEEVWMVVMVVRCEKNFLLFLIRVQYLMGIESVLIWKRSEK